MSEIRALGYLGFGVSDLPAWQSFATEFLGLQAIAREDGAVDLRMDDYAFRIRLHAGGPDDLAYIGWEVADAAALDAVARRLETAGTSVTRGAAADAADRHVEALIRFTDPNGIASEVFYGPRQRTEVPFVSPLGVAFKTGRQGLGHVVLICPDAAALESWYRDTLGFRLSDYVHARLPSGHRLDFTFMRCNSRHHSLAFCSLPMPRKLQHFMLEVDSIDHVGRATYVAPKRGIHTSLTFGRHSNDNMLSTYFMTPSGFDVEYGWGGLEVDEESWHVLSHDVPSAWGHEFRPPPPPKA